MRVVFMGKSKRSAVRALDWLVEQGVDVAAVVAAGARRARPRAAQRLDLAARRHGLPLRERGRALRGPAGRMWTWSSRSCSGTGSASR